MAIWTRRTLFLIFLLPLVGCLKAPSSGDSESEPTRLYGEIGSEKAYCSTVATPSPATAVTATAQYKYRQVNRAVGLTTAATGNIRFAEVQVLDSAGNSIQCGETDASGNISINIPRTAGTYTLKVLSRADNVKIKASILNNPTAMLPYSISTTFTLAGNEVTKAVTLTPADYSNTLEGGAFNILDQIYLANEYIRNNSACAVCTVFTVAPKVRIFWTPGLSPGAYYSKPESAISFFVDTDEAALGVATGIYIMGGINGSTCVDTDHFDNSVVIHEYGHYLEKAMAYSNSPGGSHTGAGQIDARLAWSEGWSNFFQGAVRSVGYYTDTKGNSDCSTGTGVLVDLDLENQTQDVASQSGEGIFREVSVSRALWDTMGSKVGGDSQGADVGFSYVWNVFTDTANGFRSTNVHFRNMGHFNEFMRSLINVNSNSKLADFDALVTNEKQRSDRMEYARVVSPQVAACTFDLTGLAGVTNYARDVDFYSYYYDGTAAHATITMKYAAAGGGTPSDLDLYGWVETYSFDDTATLVGSSGRFYPEAGGVGTEVITFSGRPAGYYMIQVQVDADNVRSAARYYLETNSGSERLCP